MKTVFIWVIYYMGKYSTRPMNKVNIARVLYFPITHTQMNTVLHGLHNIKIINNITDKVRFW